MEQNDNSLNPLLMEIPSNVNTDLFVGYKVHKIDAKGRISIPASMRNTLGEEFIVSRGVGDCIALYPMDQWFKFMVRFDKIKDPIQKQQIQMFFNANAEKMSLDGQGRLLLNEETMKQVNIEKQNDAVVYGNTNKIEIWNCDSFNSKYKQIEVKDVVDIMKEYGI